MKNCKNCGAQNEDNAKFCLGCGKNDFEQPVQNYQQIQQPPAKKGKPIRVVLIILGVIISLSLLSSLFDKSPSEADSTTTTTVEITDDASKTKETTSDKAVIETSAKTTIEVTTTTKKSP